MKKGLSMRRIGIALTTAAALLVPAVAQAHVTIQPAEAAAGSFTVLEVRVPNETDNVNTTKVDVRFPPGFAEASYQPIPGWSVKVIRRKLAEPVQTDDGPITEGVHEIIWTGNGGEGKIAPGEFMDFPLSVQVPGEAGDTLTFKTLQTYDDGEVVRWIGSPSSENPAPQVLVGAAEAESAHAEGASAQASQAQSTDHDDSASKDLGLAALIVGALGLIAGVTALVRSRR
jgi:periplasmic copper chaperone A